MNFKTYLEDHLYAVGEVPRLAEKYGLDVQHRGQTLNRVISYATAYRGSIK